MENKLMAAFLENGWKYIDTVDSLDWRFKEIVKLESIWRPVGVPIYLVSLVDPMDEDLKKVWAVSITDRLPTDDKFKSITQLTLKEIHRKNLKELVTTINHSRCTEKAKCD